MTGWTDEVEGFESDLHCGKKIILEMGCGKGNSRDTRFDFEISFSTIQSLEKRKKLALNNTSRSGTTIYREVILTVNLIWVGD